MQDAVHRGRIVRFGIFELDLESEELHRNGLKLKLSGQPFQVLTILLERPGRIVTREELQKRLWSDTFVDADHSLNTAINKIREVLGDSADTPRFVETLPRRGYRFIAPIATTSEEGDGPGNSRGDSAPLSNSGPSDAAEVSRAQSGSRVLHLRPRGAWAIGLVLIIAIGSLFVVLRTTHTHALAQNEYQASSTIQIVPVTTGLGSSWAPVFSPNGAWFAFIWERPERRRGEVFVQLLGSATPLRLTYSTRGRLGPPSWSPDGREIAFVRCDGKEDGVFVVPALGGAERRLTNGGCLDFLPGTVSYLRDGKGLLMMDRCSAAERPGLVLFSLTTGEKQCLERPSPSNGISHVWSFSLSPDGGTIAFTASGPVGSADYSDIYVIPLSGGAPHRLTTDSQSSTPLMWTPDGKSIVFYGRRTLPWLWRVPAKGGEIQREVRYPAIGSLAADGRRLLYSEETEETPSIWRADLAGPGGPVLTNAVYIQSTYGDLNAQPDPVGTRIVWASWRTGFGEIWLSDAAGENPSQITHLNQFSGSPRWSPDGQWISFDFNTSSGSQIYVIDPDGRRLRPITNTPNANVRPSWSRDGNSIYFTSDRTGRFEVWKHSLKGGDEVQVTRNGGFNPFESYDGRTIYYTKDYNGFDNSGEAGIWSMPINGGPESLVVPGKPQLGCAGYWAITKDGLYLLDSDAEPGPSIEFYRFDTRGISHVLTLGKRPMTLEPGLSATSNGKTIYYTQDDDRSTIKMMEIAR